MCCSAKRSPSIFHKGRNTHFSNTAQGFLRGGDLSWSSFVSNNNIIITIFMKSRTKGQNAIWKSLLCRFDWTILVTLISSMKSGANLCIILLQSLAGTLQRHKECCNVAHNQNMMSICGDFSVLLKSVPCHLVANSLHSTFPTSFCLHLMWRKWLQICTGLIEFCYWYFEVCSHLLFVFVHGDEILVLQKKKRKRKQLPILLLLIINFIQCYFLTFLKLLLAVLGIRELSNCNVCALIIVWLLTKFRGFWYKGS